MHAAARLIEPDGRVDRLLGSLPLPLLLVAPAAVVLAIAAITPEQTRLGFATDLDVYRMYAVDILAGQAPYRNVQIEYPPLAIAPMVIPLLGAPAGLDPPGYLWRFAAMQAAILVAVGWLIHRLSGALSRRALGAWTVLAGLSWVAILFRYDIWPVATMAAAVLLADRRRPGAAGLALGLGTMLKLFPAALLPVLVMHALVRRDRWAAVRMAGGWAAVVLVVQGAAWLVAGPDSVGWLRYQAERGLQVESVGAGILLGLHLFGYPVEAGFGFGSVQVEAAEAPLLAAVSPLVLGILLLAAAVVSARRFRADQARLGQVPLPALALACLAVVTGLLVGSKVLSFQYVLWLAPFAPFLSARGRWLAAAIAGLSTWIYTWDYVGLWHFQPEMIGALLARNALLLAFGAQVLRELWATQRTGAEVTPSEATFRPGTSQTFAPAPGSET